MSGVLLLVGITLFVLGLGGVLLRRSLLVAMMGGVLSSMGSALVFGHFALVRQDPEGVARGVLLLLLSGCLAVVGGGLAIAIYRRRGTVNLDELRELSG
jgi:NADH-quinone oxidoreductase subunit K